MAENNSIQLATDFLADSILKLQMMNIYNEDVDLRKCLLTRSVANNTWKFVCEEYPKPLHLRRPLAPQFEVPEKQANN